MRELPFAHEEQLKTMMRLKPAAKLPSKVVEFYWKVKSYADRVTGPLMDANHLAMIIVFSKVSETEITDAARAAEPPPPPPVDEGFVHDDDIDEDIVSQPVVDEMDWAKVQPGKDVMIHAGQFAGKIGWLVKCEAGGTLQIDIAGDSANYRKIDPDEVRLVG